MYFSALQKKQQLTAERSGTAVPTTQAVGVAGAGAGAGTLLRPGFEIRCIPVHLVSAA